MTEENEEEKNKIDPAMQNSPPAKQQPDLQLYF